MLEKLVKKGKINNIRLATKLCMTISSWFINVQGGQEILVLHKQINTGC